MADILNLVEIYAPPQKVYDSIIPARWWSTEIEGNGAVGTKLTIHFGTDWTVVAEVLEATPGQRVHWRIVEHDSDEWPGTELKFDLTEETSDGETWTTLRFTHQGWREASDFFRFCSTKWVTFLLSIKQLAETGTGTPYPKEIKIGRRG